MIPQRVSLVTIGAWDLPKLRDFYKKLGWSETDWSSDNYAVFKTAGGVLSLWSIHEMTKDVDIPILETPNYFRGVTLSINVDKPNQVDDVIEKAREAGAKITSEANDAFWGGRSGAFMDPENNFWEVAFNPNAIFDERGAMIEMNGELTLLNRVSPERSFCRQLGSVQSLVLSVIMAVRIESPLPIL